MHLGVKWVKERRKEGKISSTWLENVEVFGKFSRRERK